MVRSPLVAANPITLPQCPLCTAQPERVKWYLVGVAPRQASVGCICGYFSWVSLWVFQLDVFVRNEHSVSSFFASTWLGVDGVDLLECLFILKILNVCTIVRRSMMMRGGREEKKRQENAKQRLHILICHCLCHINTVKQFAVSAAFYLAGLCATNQTVKAGFEFIVHIIACPL